MQRFKKEITKLRNKGLIYAEWPMMFQRFNYLHDKFDQLLLILITSKSYNRNRMFYHFNEIDRTNKKIYKTSLNLIRAYRVIDDITIFKPI